MAAKHRIKAAKSRMNNIERETSRREREKEKRRSRALHNIRAIANAPYEKGKSEGTG